MGHTFLTSGIRVILFLHDVGFVDGRHAASLVVSGVFEGVLGDASAGVLSDQLDALNDAVDDLRQRDQTGASEQRDHTRSWLITQDPG